MKKEEPIRIAIMALILAVFLGIKQSIPKDKTFEFITMELTLKVISNVFFSVVLIIFIFYLLSLALFFGYKNGFKPKIFGFLHDLAITLTIAIVFLGFAITSVIWLVINFPDYIKPGLTTNLILGISILLATILSYKNLSAYIDEIGIYFLKTIRKIIKRLN